MIIMTQPLLFHYFPLIFIIFCFYAGRDTDFNLIIFSNILSYIYKYDLKIISPDLNYLENNISEEKMTLNLYACNSLNFIKNT